MQIDRPLCQNLEKGIVEAQHILSLDLELMVLVFAVLQNQRVLRRDGIVWLSGEKFSIEQLFDYGGILLVWPHHEQNGRHKPDLMPQESIADEVKIVYLVSWVVICTFPLCKFLNPRLLYRSFMVGRRHHINPAEIYKVVRALKTLDGLFHSLQIKEAFQEEILVGSLCAPVASVELLGDFLAG